MKFANVNGIRSEAQPGAKGKCPLCNSNVNAFCGEIKTHHWKHESKYNCDQWYESETQWHRDWKNKFKIEQQEYIFTDPSSNEKHIADVYNKRLEIVFEFQHSPISIDEIFSRESFYKKMVWVVDVKNSIKNITLFENNLKNFKTHIYDNWINNYYPFSDFFTKNKIKNNFNCNNELEYIDALSKKYFNKPIIGRSDNFEFEPRLKNQKTNNLLSKIKIMEWKFQHKRWNYSNMPTFFDFGDDCIYLRKDAVPMLNKFVVKVYSKDKFLNHYSR